MTIDLFNQIKTRYNGFSKAEKKVADYILRNHERVIYMSITDLAEACEIGESSVFRFCKSIGLQGYQELKIKLAHSLNNSPPAQPIEVSMEDTTKSISENLFLTTQSSLQDTYNLLNEEDIQKTVDLFVNANRIYFFGVGSSMITAMDAKSKFMRITNKTEMTSDPHLQSMTASLMTKDDVGVFFSYSGSTKDTMETARIAHQRGAKIVAITRFMKSPLTNYADITLLSGANEGPLQGGSLSAKISQLFILDLLYTEYFRITSDESTVNKKLTAKSVVDKLV